MKKIFTLIAVAMLALAANAENLTICGGEYYSGSVPVYGLWYDTPGMTQQIYPADSLTAMTGGKINKITFYTLACLGATEYGDFTEYVLKFSGGEIVLSLLEVEQTNFTEAVAIEGAQVAATLVPEAGGTEMTFVLDEPFEYHGGNLLVQVEVTEPGEYATTYFWGTASEDESAPATTYIANSNYSGDVTENISNVLARVTFDYSFGNEETKYYITGGFNGWEADNPVELTEEGYTFKVEQNGDQYWDCFKLLTAGENDWTWIGGISENPDYPYFDVTEELMAASQELDLYAGDEGKNFRLPGEGSYTVTLVREEGAKDPLAGVKIVVAKANEPTPTAVNDINSKAVAGVKYYNLAGVESNKPFDGVNIMVTTYTDGTKSAVKVVK